MSIEQKLDVKTSISGPRLFFLYFCLLLHFLAELLVDIEGGVDPGACQLISDRNEGSRLESRMRVTHKRYKFFTEKFFGGSFLLL